MHILSFLLHTTNEVGKMDIRLKWFYRLGFLLLLFIVLFTFLKLQPLWLPVIRTLFIIIFPFAAAAFITYLLHPVVERLHEAGLHRGLAVIIIYTLFFGGTGYALYKGLPAIIVQIRDLAEHAPQLADQYREWLLLLQSKTSQWPEPVQLRIDEGIQSLEASLDRLLSRAMAFAGAILNFALILIIIPFISFYMLKDFLLMKKAVWYLTPKKWRESGSLFLRDADKSLGSYIRGQLLVCAVIGALSSLFFWIAGIKYPLLLGAIIGATNVIPYFGPIIGAVPAVLIASTMSVKMIIFAAVIVMVLQFLEGNILSPLIVGKSLHMHPLLIMFSLLAGGEIAGVAGLILAVPVLAVLKVGAIHARRHFTAKPAAE
ncbi:hypothetical protein B14911_01700 [Bacillus sp. NRRL B-14911]|nr:hypothetical protein B14911_01700 [Bacillus sp. NRRL B-14911]